MKKYTVLIFFLTAACSTSSVLDDPFIKNLKEANLHDVSMELDASTNLVYSVLGDSPIEYTASTDSFTINRRGISYKFIRALNRNQAIFFYVGQARGTVPPEESIYPCYIGFVLYKNGLYQVGKKVSSPTADTYEATVAYYSITNINFNDIIPGPLYQTPGTSPAIP